MTAPEEMKYTLVCTCGARMLITAANLGKTGKCGQCGAVITACPENTTPVAVTAPTVPATPPPPPVPTAPPPPAVVSAPVSPPAAEETKYTLVCTCGAQMLIPGAYLGKAGKCGQCGAVITALPENTSPVAAAIPAAPVIPTPTSPTPPSATPVTPPSTVPVAPPPPAAAPAPVTPPATEGGKEDIRAGFQKWVSEQVLVRLSPYASDCCYGAPQIPPEIIDGARSSYLTLTYGEPVLFLADNSIFGKGNAGMVLTDRQFAWYATGGGEKFCVPYEAVQEMRHDGSRLFARVHDTEYCLITRWDVRLKPLAIPLLELFQRIREKLHEEGLGESTAQAIAAPSVTSAPAASPPTSVSEAIRTTFASFATDKLFLAPHIPEKKLKNASDAYLHPAPGEEVMVLFDDTVFGNAKGGFCLTNQRLAWKGKGPLSLPYTELFSITAARADANGISLTTSQGEHVLNFIQWGKKEKHALCLGLMAVLHMLAQEHPEADIRAAITALERMSSEINPDTARRVHASTTDSTGFVPEQFEVPELPEPTRTQVREAILTAIPDYQEPPLFVAPAIPPDRLLGAAATYLRLLPGETVLVMYDNSLSGTGKTGLCLTDRRVVWKQGERVSSLAHTNVTNMSYHVKALNIEVLGKACQFDLAELERKKKDALALALTRICLIVTGSPEIVLLRMTHAFYTSAPAPREQQGGVVGLTSNTLIWSSLGATAPLRLELAKVANVRLHAGGEQFSFREQDGTRHEFLLGDGAVEWASAIEATRTALGSPPAPITGAGIPELVLTTLRAHTSEELHLAPAIPEKKLKAARYLTLAPDEQLLALHQDTGWLSAKRALAFTNQRIVGLMQGEPFEIAYPNLLDAEYAGEAIVLMAPGVVYCINLPWSNVAARAITLLALRIIDDLDRPRPGKALLESNWHFLHADQAEIVEVDNEEVEHVAGVLALTTKELLWCKEDTAAPLVIPLTAISHAVDWAGTFSVVFHDRQRGLLGSLGLANKSLNLKPKRDWRRWVHAINNAVADAAQHGET